MTSEGVGEMFAGGFADTWERATPSWVRKWGARANSDSEEY